VILILVLIDPEHSYRQLKATKNDGILIKLHCKGEGIFVYLGRDCCKNELKYVEHYHPIMGEITHKYKYITTALLEELIVI